MRFATDKVTHGYLPAYLRIAADVEDITYRYGLAVLRKAR